MSADEDHPKLKPADVAQRLGTSESFVYAEIERRHLPAHRLGKGKGVYRISEAQFQQYVARTRVQESSPCPSADYRTASFKPTSKTKRGVSHELNALLKPAKKPASGARPSSAKRRIVSWDTKDDGYSGKH